MWLRILGIYGKEAHNGIDATTKAGAFDPNQP